MFFIFFLNCGPKDPLPATNLVASTSAQTQPLPTTTPPTSPYPQLQERLSASHQSLQIQCWMKPIPNPNIAKMPCLLEADLDGDTINDTAILILDTNTQKKGVAILHGNGSNSILGAGNAIGNGGDNFRWMNIWNVEDTPKSMTNPVVPKALYVGKYESAGGFIYWDGSAFVWLQHGD